MQISLSAKRGEMMSARNTIMIHLDFFLPKLRYELKVNVP